MLTLQQCKTILNDNELTDEEVLLMRDWLYQLADLAIEMMDKNELGSIEEEKA
jgi:hypothetical protein